MSFALAAYLLGLPAPVSVIAQQPMNTTALPTDTTHRFVEGSATTFRLSGGLLAGRAAGQALSVLNFFGTKKQISDGLKVQEPLIRQMLHDSRMPGVLVYVEQQTSMTDVQLTSLIGGKPLLVGPGLNQLSTWEAYRALGKDAFDPIPTEGYRRNEDASFFLWATEAGGNIEYGLTTPSTLITNEARRDLSDSELRQAFLARYDSDLLASLVGDIEKRASGKPLHDQAKSLLDSRQQALEERRRINIELQQALEHAARAQRVAAVFDTLSQVLTVTQLGMNLAAEFPDKADAISHSKSMEDLKGILVGVTKDAETKQGEVAGTLRTLEDRQRNIKIEELKIIRAQQINLDVVPGVLP